MGRIAYSDCLFGLPTRARDRNGEVGIGGSRPVCWRGGSRRRWPGGGAFRHVEDDGRLLGGEAGLLAHGRGGVASQVSRAAVQECFKDRSCWSNNTGIFPQHLVPRSRRPDLRKWRKHGRSCAAGQAGGAGTPKPTPRADTSGIHNGVGGNGTPTSGEGCRHPSPARQEVWMGSWRAARRTTGGRDCGAGRGSSRRS
jgi:hypothetical protein